MSAGSTVNETVIDRYVKMLCPCSMDHDTLEFPDSHAHYNNISRFEDSHTNTNTTLHRTSSSGNNTNTRTTYFPHSITPRSI